MRYRTLGDSDIRVSEISFGCWTLGGQNWANGVPVGWADVEEDEAIRAIHWAIDAGVNHFDNADVYGNGRAERMLAKALGSRRDKVIVATKVGHFHGTAAHAYEPQHIRHQCEQSLLNLQTDVIDIYYFHHGDFGENDRYLDDALAEMHRLRDAGKIRLIGLSAYSSDDFARLVPRIRPTVLQSWANLIDDQFIRPGGVVAGLLQEYGMSFVAFSPLAQGLVLGKYKEDAREHFAPGDFRGRQERFSPENIRAVNAEVAKIGEKFGGSTEDLARVAQQYVLGHANVACVIPGFRNLQQAQCNAAAADKPLTPEEIESLRDKLPKCWG